MSGEGDGSVSGERKRGCLRERGEREKGETEGRERVEREERLECRKRGERGGV